MQFSPYRFPWFIVHRMIGFKLVLFSILNPIWVSMMKGQKRDWIKTKKKFEATKKKPSFAAVMAKRAIRIDIPSSIPMIGMELEGFISFTGPD